MGHFKDEAIKKMIDPAKSRRGKNARNRGNAFEREVAAKLNGRRIGWAGGPTDVATGIYDCLLYTSPSPRDRQKSRMPSSA